MYLKSILKHAFITALVTLFAAFTTQADDRPNIIIIYADDIGYGDFGCYGGTGVDTPATDALAEGGIRFLGGYASAATCTPSRYSLLTGQYAFRNQNARILPGNAPLIIDTERPTIASFLKDAGYNTALIGKWHLGLGSADEPLDWNGLIAPGPKELGFEYSFHMAATGDRVPSVYIENGRIVDLDPNDPVEVSYRVPIGDEPTGVSHPEMLKQQADLQHSGTIVNGISRIGFMTGGHAARFKDEEMGDDYLKKAIEYIEDNKDEPFFMFYATHENHVPRVPHPRFVGSSSLGLRGDAISQFDWGVGKLVETLERLEIRDNTLIILSSDNGPVLFDGYWDAAIEYNGDHNAAGPWRGGKYSRWEGGTRMPFIVNWPAKVKPGISDAIVSQVDLFASIATIIDEDLPEIEGFDSEDVSDALLGKSPHGREYLVQEALAQVALRKGNWKYIPPGTVRVRGGIGKHHVTQVTGRGFLFHLSEDPGETRNLAEDYPHIVDEMIEILRKEAPGKISDNLTSDDAQMGF